MASSLVIVESVAKARTIEKYLGKGYKVLPSVGHVIDLVTSAMGIDFANGYAPNYIVKKDRKETLEKIVAAARSSKDLILATDPDREGEAIAWHLSDAVRNGIPLGKRRKKIKKGENTDVPTRRVLFHEITKKGISDGMAAPRAIDAHLFDAQQARRFLDRIVGYTLSEYLSDKFGQKGLSAGRVQSIAVKIVCEREKAIRAFVPEEYWSLTARFKATVPPTFASKLHSVGGEKIRPSTGVEANALRDVVESGPFVVRDVRKKARKRTAPAPFTTSKLQQEASKVLGWQPHRTMQVAQALYEGVEIPGSGLVGLITYMRTDSLRVSDEAVAAVRDHISAEYGPSFLPEAPNAFKNKKSAQDAHEAIRPTSIDFPPSAIRDLLGRQEKGKDLFRLYELIWKRFVASQMTPAEFEQTSVDIVCEPSGAPAGGYLFRSTGSVPVFPGFLKAYEFDARGVDAGKESTDVDQSPDGEEREENAVLPPLTTGEVMSLVELVPAQHFTQPPPRFTESSLVKELEEDGIGRPSTYAATLKTIRDRKYVEQNADRRLAPTDLGFRTNDFLDSFLQNSVMDIAFTAGLEEELDKVEAGELSLKAVLDEFLHRFNADMKNAPPPPERKPLGPCPDCKEGELSIRRGRTGEFVGCSRFPDCRFTSNFRRVDGGEVELVADEEAGVDCEKCGKPMILRRNRGSRYIACSGYPDCRNTKPFHIGVPCPACNEGGLVEKSSRFGKPFFSCSRYPECTFAAWSVPEKETCPVCSFPAMAKRAKKSGEEYFACLRKGCRGRKNAASAPDSAEG